MLRHLARLGQVHLACFADDAVDAAHLSALRDALGGRLGEAHVEVRRKGKVQAAAEALASGKPVSLTLFGSPSMRSFVQEVAARPDVGTIFAFSGQMAQFVPERLRQLFVMDFVDMDSAKFGDYAAASPLAWLYRREAARLFAFERSVAARADASLFVSEAEARLFRGRAALPGADIRAVGNGVDLRFYDPEAAIPHLANEERGEGPLIVFTGQMDYRPNVEAVSAFAQDVLPGIRTRRPDARFAIVGRKPVPAVERLGDLQGVTVTGAVDDVRSWLAAADLVVAPLRIARGVQNKVLEAMAMGKAVVASPAAFEGIDAEPGRDLVVSGEEEQGAAVLDLLDDKAKRDELGAAARRQMISAYRWDARLAPLAEIVGQLRKVAA